MKVQEFVRISGILFATIAVLHLCRMALGWEVALNGQQVPVWPSWLAVVFFGTLTYVAFRLRS